jgi:hypothetical protein
MSSEHTPAIELARETVARLDDDTDHLYALRIITMAYALLMHHGRGARWIRDAEDESCGPHVGCEREDVFMNCYDENEDSYHPKLDELSDAFETARPMLEALMELEDDDA